MKEKGLVEEGNEIDVKEREEVEEMDEDILRSFGGIEVLVKNEGVEGREELEKKEEVEVWERVIGVKIEGELNV